MQQPYKMSEDLREQFEYFFEQHPPHLFARYLRNMLMDYLYNELSCGMPNDLEELLFSLSSLFHLLDDTAEEMANKSIMVGDTKTESED